MNEDGWPVVLPWRYAGEMAEKVPAERQTGTYKIILHKRDINKTEHSSLVVSLLPDGTIAGDLTGIWNCPDGQSFRCELDGITYHGVMDIVLDSSVNAWVPCFSALDASGAALWGSKLPE